MADIPLQFSSTGPVPTRPNVLLENLIDGVMETNPGYTANLPASLIEDVSSTQVGGMSMIDQARVDAVNGVSLYASNPYLLDQQGSVFGIPKGLPSNASVYVVISGPAGYVINPGFIVSDGTNQYRVINGGTIGVSGDTQPLFCSAINPGEFSIPANTVNIIITSIPAGFDLTVTNPIAGIPAISSETEEQYRSRILEATNIVGQGTPTYIKTLVKKVLGVDPRLVSVQQAPGGWEVIVGGGDPYEVAGAIYSGVLDLTSIVGSIHSERNITITIFDAPDYYNVTFVDPPQQNFTAIINWSTTLPDFGSGPQVNQLMSPAVISYINSIPVGQPINILEMQAIIQDAVSSILPPVYLTTLVIQVYINNILTPPNSGTSIIPGDFESYFFAAEDSVSINP